MEQDAIQVKGMFRVHIMDAEHPNKVVGDSGWHSNLIVNNGFRDFLCRALGALANSSQVNYVGLGTGAGPSAADTALGSEVGTRTAVTAATSNTSKAVQFTATFAAGWHSSSGVGYGISSIGLYQTSTGSNLFAGTTFTSSACASNQAVQVTYAISFT
jgi:hypothetical protein